MWMIYNNELTGMQRKVRMGQEHLTYIPVSSFIILLVILLTCASRRKKTDAFSAVEQNLENDIKGEYAIMCFPCLRKKPDLSEFEPASDLSDQFEYVVEKYTVRKVPLLLANTAEDIIERREELEMGNISKGEPELVKDDFVNFKLAHEVYNVQKIPTSYTIAPNTACPRKPGKDRPKPSDILESMSPINRPPVKNRNYVVIPTKGSLRHKDIMLTKREITNQYLNNFSSVFIDNLKDQVPKDPEQFPSLSRPYTNAFKNFPIDESVVSKSTGSKKSKRRKSQKVAYAFPTDEKDKKEDESVKEPFFDSDSTQDQTTDILDSDFQVDTENEVLEKTKSLVLLNDCDSLQGEVVSPYPFKTTIKSSVSEIERERTSSVANSTGIQSSFLTHRIDWGYTRNVTYEDIQALDLGYEFKSCEKLGVKPKMTKIHYPLVTPENERIKESIKQLAVGEPKKIKKKYLSDDHWVSSAQSSKTTVKSSFVKTNDGSESFNVNTLFSPSRKVSSRSVITETSFLPKTEAVKVEKESPKPDLKRENASNTGFTPRSDDSKSGSSNDFDTPNALTTTIDSVAEISKLYELSAPVAQQGSISNASSEIRGAKDQRFPRVSKSRSFHEAGSSGARKDSPLEAKGKDKYQSLYTTKTDIIRLDEPETETSCSLFSHESKTSTVVTTPKSSEGDEGKRATLRWKIVIKHHKEKNSSRKNVNLNLKH